MYLILIANKTNKKTAVVSFIVVFLYCVCALNVCNVCYLSVLLLYYCHRAKVQLQFNVYTYTVDTLTPR
jgi:hypothetical protein